MAEMIDPTQLVSVLDTLGTIGLVALGVWAFYTRRICVKGEVDEARAEHARQLAYVEERRHDERQARIAAEQRLEALVESVEKVTEVMQAIQIELVRSRAGEHHGDGDLRP